MTTIKVLKSARSGGWKRDLLAEGLESNPGPTWDELLMQIDSKFSGSGTPTVVKNSLMELKKDIDFKYPNVLYVDTDQVKAFFATTDDLKYLPESQIIKLVTEAIGEMEVCPQKRKRDKSEDNESKKTKITYELEENPISCISTKVQSPDVSTNQKNMKQHIEQNESEDWQEKEEFNSISMNIQDSLPKTIPELVLVDQKMKWVQVFENLFLEPVPKKLADLSLDALLQKKKKPQNIQDFCDSVVSSVFGYPVLVPTQLDIVALFGVGAVGSLALAAAVGPAVAAAVGPAVGPVVIAAVGIVSKNNRIVNKNAKAFEAINSLGQQQLFSLLKENAGVGPGLPNGAPIPANFPLGHPFAIGTPIPLPFPPNTTTALTLTHVQLNQLSIMYNDTFGVIAADDAITTRNKFNQWISGY